VLNLIERHLGASHQVTSARIEALPLLVGPTFYVDGLDVFTAGATALIEIGRIMNVIRKDTPALAEALRVDPLDVVINYRDRLPILGERR